MKPSPRNRQHGSVLLAFVALILAAMSFVIVKALNSSTEAGRNEATAANMLKAKEALVGFAASYQDTHTAQINGYLPLPDLGSNRNTTPGEGVAAGMFTGNTSELSVVGRLPWKTLGLSPLRDSNGECLWYAVSGTFQDAQKSNVIFMNWDTLGQFDTYSSNGTAAGTVSTIGTNYHQRPAAIIIAPGGITSGQTRTASAVDTVTECGGNYGARNYLDTFNANPLLNNIVNYFTGAPNNSIETFTFAAPKRIVMSTVWDASDNLLANDMVQAITADDIFRVIRQSSGFGNYVTNNLLGAAASNLSLTLPPAAPATLHFPPVTPTETPTETAGGTVFGSLEIGRVPSAALTTDDLEAWQDNLLYARCTSGLGCLTVNGTANCTGVVIFAGNRLASQTRGSDAQKSSAWNNYLEDVAPGNILTAFTTGTTTFTGNAAYSTASSTSDVLACVTSPNPGTTQKSFAADFASFITAGTGVTANSTIQTVTIANAAGTSGGCFWLPSTVTFAGKTVRSYYEYQFGYADTYAVTGSGTDRGNGITLDIVDGSIGSPTAQCGLASRMGAFVVGDPTGMWALESFTIETDVRRDAANNDSVENHTAIMANGNPAHSAANGNLTGACDGTAAGCRATPANKFEESLTPLLHNQRIEIHSGCNSTCSTCNPASHVSPNTYVKISTWVDCTDCNDVTSDSVTTPTINRCIILTTELNAPYIALTGGFRSGAGIQSVTLSNFILRSE